MGQTEADNERSKEKIKQLRVPSPGDKRQHRLLELIEHVPRYPNNLLFPHWPKGLKCYLYTHAVYSPWAHALCIAMILLLGVRYFSKSR